MVIHHSIANISGFPIASRQGEDAPDWPPFRGAPRSPGRSLSWITVCWTISSSPFSTPVRASLRRERHQCYAGTGGAHPGEIVFSAADRDAAASDPDLATYGDHIYVRAGGRRANATLYVVLVDQYTEGHLERGDVLWIDRREQRRRRTGTHAQVRQHVGSRNLGESVLGRGPVRTVQWIMRC